MAASAAAPGLFLCFAATILPSLASASTPTWNAISFLNAHQGGRTLRFGVFGYEGSGTRVGYHFDSAYLGYDDHSLNSFVLHSLTYSLILVPIAAGLSGIAVLFGLCGVAYRRSGTILMTVFSVLATVVTLVAWVLAMVLFGYAKSHLKDHGYSAQYHNAMWLVLGALVSLALAFCSSAIGIFESPRRSRTEASPASY